MLRLGDALPPGGPRRRGARGVQAGGRARARARRSRAARPRGDRLRGDVLAPCDPRRRGRRAARGGGRRARARTTPSCARVALSGLARALDLRGELEPRGVRARRVDRDVAPARRTARALAATLAMAYWSRGSSRRTRTSTGCCSRRATSDASWTTSRSRARRSPGSSRPYVVLCDHDAAQGDGRPPVRRRAQAEPAVPPSRRRALRGRARALRRRPRGDRAGGEPLPGVGPSADGPRRVGDVRRSRCSACAVSRGGWPSSRRSCASWTRTRATARGGPASPRSTPSSAWSTTRAASCGAFSTTASARCGRRSGSRRSSTSPTRVRRSATPRWPRRSIPSSWRTPAPT